MVRPGRRDDLFHVQRDTRVGPRASATADFVVISPAGTASRNVSAEVVVVTPDLVVRATISAGRLPIVTGAPLTTTTSADRLIRYYLRLDSPTLRAGSRGRSARPRTVRGVGVTGVIFAIIAAFWLVYLIPYYLQHRGDADDGEVEIPFTPSAVTIVRSGESLAQADEGAPEISTPLTRRAQLRELRMIDEQAAQRRRRVLIFLLLVQLGVAALAYFGIGAWWAAAIPAGVLVLFLIVARFSVRAMRADLDRRADRIKQSFDEQTVALALTDQDGHEHSVELSVPITGLGSLWDPVPITRPTYVSTPLAPRTVRTIDLSAPVAPAALTTPVVAETPADELTREVEGEREAG